jgi:NADPH2:quinone reductase
MRAFRVLAYGTPPAPDEIAEPVPGPGEALVRIRACGLNFADTLIAEGRYQERPAPPVTLGMELAGVVEALGPGTEGPAPGTRVAVFSGQGGLAEAGVFPAARCIPIPDAMPFEVAAGFLVAYGTSHLALDHRARLRPGERLVVTGAAGGVGLTAVEIGARMGAEVVAVARGTDKLDAARAAGAHHLIDAEAPDLRDRLRALGGADVVYETVGGALWDACFRAARPEARLLAIGFASGTVPEIKANHLLVKNLTVIGLYWGGYLGFAPEVLTASLATLLGWWRDGGLRPHVSHVLPLDRAAEGLDLIRSRRSTGKVVVTMPG